MPSTYQTSITASTSASTLILHIRITGTQKATGSVNTHRDIPPLANLDLHTIHNAYRNHLFTAVDLTSAYLARIRELNPEFCALAEVDPDAIAAAHILEAERLTNGPRGFLHGIPILVKDNMPTLDSTSTTCGSVALLGARPPREAGVVTAVRKAGAIVLGKGNMAEWAGFRSTSGCSGWSARGGQTKGIYYPGMKASGSSGGCAVAVAAGMCFAALGTETCYSIVSPAEKSGIVGFKPTSGLISSEGLIHTSKRLDTVGVLTRTVSDACLFFLSLAQQSDHLPLPTKQKLVHDLSTACSNTHLYGVRIGVPTDLDELQNLLPCKKEAFERTLTLLEGAGASIVRNVQIPGAQSWEALPQEAKNAILNTDMKIAINAYLSSLATNPNNIRNLQDLITFTRAHPAEQYPQRNVEGLEKAVASDPDGHLFKTMLAKDEYYIGEGGIEAALCRKRCDIMILPTLSVTMQSFAAKAGSPVMSVPMGMFSEDAPVEKDSKNGLINVAPGIPFSAYIFGRAAKDEDVFKVGRVLEQLTKIRETLVPYVDLMTQ
ncbi:amidase [Alternaria panax]|uniref:Amidase n=1 Tax=Alternaria panax TaxID=48097 RepID=A0AAD4FL54_9PLEO|nr:amidase [Alternaria panax]